MFGSTENRLYFIFISCFLWVPPPKNLFGFVFCSQDLKCDYEIFFFFLYTNRRYISPLTSSSLSIQPFLAAYNQNPSSKHSIVWDFLSPLGDDFLVRLADFGSLLGFFFFLISTNNIYTKGYSIHEKHRANSENYKKKKKKKQRKYIKENQATN